MLAALSVAIAMLAEGVGEAPANPPPAAPPAAAQPAAAVQPAAAAQPATIDRCPKLPPDAHPGEIVVCGQKPQGFRIDPDVLEASRGKHGGGRHKRPERLGDTSCAVVGPAGCIGAGAGINLIGAALTAAQMAERLAKGQEIGSMFRTTPEESEYELYKDAKREREAKEAEAAAVKAAKAKAAAKATAAAQQEGAGKSPP